MSLSSSVLATFTDEEIGVIVLSLEADASDDEPVMTKEYVKIRKELIETFCAEWDRRGLQVEHFEEPDEDDENSVKEDLLS